jgi:hypothetical protein
MGLGDPLRDRQSESRPVGHRFGFFNPIEPFKNVGDRLFWNTDAVIRG